MLDLLTSPEAWLSLATLTVLEIVLGIDNIIFLSIVSSRLPPAQQPMARRIGLILALVMRIALLASIAWIVSLTKPIVTLFDLDISWRDIILLGGGLFLIVKGTMEIAHTVDGHEETGSGGGAKASSFGAAVAQIVMLDIVFSLDSVITAVGMSQHLPVMIAAVVLAIIVMLVASEPVARFVEKHLSVKILALAFLLMVGVALVADGLHFHIPRGYLYTAMAFSLGVECLTLFARRRRGGSAG
ncbi:TerC family protein [Radicibacter daui]|uniref:TerC family protein n=1 Tax=Radicibacter daui TaxID=3064829 RepID=UPI004046C998